MNRIVVLSDPSKEFPDNMTSTFKARLPQEVSFEGDWEVALTSISMPDRGLDLKNLFSDKVNLARVKYQMSQAGKDGYETRIENVWLKTLIENAATIVDGVGFMKALVDEIDWQIVSTLEGSSAGTVEDKRRPTFRWEGDVAVLEKKDIGVLGSHGSHNVVEFRVDEILALHMGG